MITATAIGDRWEVELARDGVRHAVRLTAANEFDAVVAAQLTLEVWHRDWQRSKRKVG